MIGPDQEQEPLARRPLSVNLVHWRQVDWCVAAAASIVASDIPVALTIINNSPESEAELLRRLPAGTEVVTTVGNPGYAGGANVALGRWISGDDELVVIGSHDLHVEPDALRTLVEVAARHPRAGVLGPVVTSKVAGSSSALAVTDAHADLNAVRWVSGTCLVLRRGCIEQIGGFDTAYGSYFEDVDLCWRAEAAGWTVGLVPAATVADLGSGDPGEREAARINTARGIRIHRGWPAAAADVGRIGVELTRAAMGSVHPGRGLQERAASRARARARGRALGRLAVLRVPPRTSLDPAAATALVARTAGDPAAAGQQG